MKKLYGKNQKPRSQLAPYLNKPVRVKIDRPLGSFHPKHKLRYEVNYGYVPHTKSADGEEADVYVLGIEKPLEEIEGKCIAIIHRLKDDDDKLIAVPFKKDDISDKEIRAKTNFQEKFFKSVIIRSLEK